MRPQFHSHQRPYTLQEVWADGVVHVTGVTAGLAASLTLFTHALWVGKSSVALAVYLVSLMAMLAISATYNIWPVSRVKWLLRRFDHAAIYLLIAGTYTPLLPFLASHTEALVLGIGIWAGALLGMALKFFAPGRYDRLALAIYLALGWAGILSAKSFLDVLPTTTMALIVAGGLIYSLGVIFHVWHRLKYQNAIWHAFVAIAAGLHFAAIAVLYL